MANANRDQNHVTTVIAKSSADADEVVALVADPVTSRLKVEAAVTSDLSNSIYTMLVDEASATTTYIGEADPGTEGSAASWRIKRVSVSGSVTSIEWADGDTSFNNVWDNRATLSYS